MEILHAEILLLRLLLHQRRRTQPPGRAMMKLKAVATALDKLNHGLEARADKLLARVGALEARGDAAFRGAHAKMDEHDAALGDLGAIVEQIEKATNGGPLAPSAPAPTTDINGVTLNPNRG